MSQVAMIQILRVDKGGWTEGKQSIVDCVVDNHENKNAATSIDG